MTSGEEWDFVRAERRSERIYEALVEAGTNLFDAANVYNHGSSERFLGEVIASHREKVVVVTK